MRGKDKCRILRQIRREIAEQNDIALVTSECRYQGECRGTCPKCEAELRYLEEELEKRRGLNKRVALVGISIGTVVALSGCAMGSDLLSAADSPTVDPTSGDAPEGVEMLLGEVEFNELEEIMPVELPDEEVASNPEIEADKDGYD